MPPPHLILTFLFVLSPHHCGSLVPIYWRIMSLRTFVATQISNNIEFNDTPEVNSGFLWEILKAFVRGQIISFSSYMHKAERTKRQDILDKLLNLYEIYAIPPSPALYKRRLLLQSDYDCLMTHIVERQLQQSKQCFFEHGDKVGRLLAQQAPVQPVPLY